MLKRLLALMVVFILLSLFITCDEDANGNGGAFKLSPPDWTLGAWQVKTSENNPKTTFTFSLENLIITNQIEPDQPPRDFNDMVNTQGYIVTESIKTSETYEVVCERGSRAPEPPPPGGGTQTFTFTKNIDVNIIDIAIKTGDTTDNEAGHKL